MKKARSGEDKRIVSNLEMVQQILVEVGDVPGDIIAALVQQRFGVHIELKYIPIYKASVREKQRLEAARQAKCLEEPGASPSGAA